MSKRISGEAESYVEPLTRREREVLDLLAQSHSAPEIAQLLTLALSTVKWHLEHIYGKLGVNSKRQAVSRARELGLLGGAGSSAPSSRHNLPLQVTRFFGRENELAQIRERLAEWRLVSLTGSGGVGKTRLSLRVAEEHLGEYADGVWFVELASLSDPSLVVQQAATALGVRDEPGRPVQETVTAFLRARQALLVLDNCEHLLPACAALAEALLRVCPHVRLLINSREALGIPGEAVHHVPSLPFPDPDHLPALESLSSYDAIRLFVDRARAWLPDYQAAAHNAAALARICQRLDGIPLAIEMAAARINVLSAEQLAGRLEDAFRLLGGSRRTALPRHQTLPAMINWSYELLNEAERRLLQRLSVFASGCTLEAAEAVCSGEGLEAGQVLDVLASLVGKSMVMAKRQPGEATRYFMLEMVRQYAREKLGAGKETDRLRARHRDYFLDFAETTQAQFASGELGLWHKIQADDHDNLRLALEWSFTGFDQVEAVPRLLLAMGWDWSRWPELFEWFKRGVAWCENRAGISAGLHAQLLVCASTVATIYMIHTGRTWSERAVEIGRGLGAEDHKTFVLSLCRLGFTHLELGDIEHAVRAFAEMEAVLLAHAPVPPSAEAWILRIKAHVAVKQGQYEAAKVYAAEVLRLLQAYPELSKTIDAYMDLGMACLNLAEFEEARASFLEALSLSAGFTGSTADNHQAHALRWLADVDIRQGNLARALDYSHASLRQANRIPDYNIIASGLGLTAIILAKQGEPERAASLSGASQAMYTRLQRPPWEDSSLDTLLPDWRKRTDHAEMSQAFEAGVGFSNEQAVALALGAAG